MPDPPCRFFRTTTVLRLRWRTSLLRSLMILWKERIGTATRDESEAEFPSNESEVGNSSFNNSNAGDSSYAGSPPLLL